MREANSTIPASVFCNGAVICQYAGNFIAKSKNLMSTHPDSVSAGEEKAKIPGHIAIIMDGNGRWAALRKMPRMYGHKQGANAARNVIEACVELGIPYLTLYTFSSENWKRPADEVENLMQLLKFYLGRELDKLTENGIRANFIGNREKLSEDVRKKLVEVEKATEKNNRLNLTVALSYGSRQEITGALRQMAVKVKNGELGPAAIDEGVFAGFLETAGLPDPDLLIRTGGEKRLSNFLLWQLAYTELYFTDILWPDFTKQDLIQAVDEFSRRERRYGTA